MKLGRSVLLLTLMFLMVGCIRSTITNLTPSRLPRNQAGLYPVEMEWASNQTALRHETVEPAVLIGTNIYPMQRTQLLTNRWEALVPVQMTNNVLRYRIKVNWKFNAVPVPEGNSQLSQEYLLLIDN